MAKRSAEVTRYIARAQPFARPVLTRIRAAFHAGCPQLTEAIKWRVPFFMHHGMLGMMAGFKHHVAWGLWQRSRLDDPKGVLDRRKGAGMGGVRLASVADLPPRAAIVALVRQAAALNAQKAKGGAQRKRPLKRRPVRPVRVPPALTQAFTKAPKAKSGFAALPPSHRREYCEWIAGAKQPATRARRVTKAIAQLKVGRSLNWRYMTKGK